MNLQGSTDGIDHSLHYVQVGTWSTGKLNLNMSAIRFFSDQRTLEELNVRRFCSEACQSGHVKVFIVKFLFTSFQIKLYSILEIY